VAVGKKRRTFLTIAAALAAFAILAACAGPALAQCAMCKSSASGLDGAGARNLNYAIIVLLFPPVAIFCALFAVAYRRRDPPDEKR
jgi:hypothetical protein